jgi:hypothetical protein
VKRVMYLICLLVGMVMVIGLSGCKIISATPDPSDIIVMKPGDKVLFKVVGPVNTATTKCVWTVTRKNFYLEDSYEVVSEGKNEFELVFNQDSKLSNKNNIITCEYQSYQLGCINNTGICSLGWAWVTTDTRKWEVLVNPNSDTVITGDYIIENDSDLQLLKGYTTVTGSLMIGPNIESLNGLGDLSTIGRYLVVSINRFIKELSALESISSIGGLWICYNDALISMSGLENITSVGGDLRISDNAALTSLSGLENLTSVGGFLYVGDNAALTALGMTGLQKVSGDFGIYSNPILCTLLAEELKDQVLAGGGIGGARNIEGNKNCTTP